jgi:membrane-associated phospholipid phosphatase
MRNRASRQVFAKSLAKSLTNARAESLAKIIVTVEQSRTIKLRAAMIVTIAVYTLAVGGSAFLNVSAPLLEGVPLWAGALIIFACASISVEALSVLVPTLGPIWALADRARFANLPTLGRTTAEIVLALRDKTLGTIDFEAVNGIISFPSMHAAVAIIVPYTLRWNRWIFWPIAALDAVMLASAVPSGNHYLADVIAGVAVAVLAIACGRAIQTSLDRLFRSRRKFDYATQRADNP